MKLDRFCDHLFQWIDNHRYESKMLKIHIYLSKYDPSDKEKRNIPLISIDLALFRLPIFLLFEVQALLRLILNRGWLK